MSWRPSLTSSFSLLNGMVCLPHSLEQPAAGLFPGPPPREEENPEANKPQRAAYFVVDVAEVEPAHGDGEVDHPEVDQRLRGQPHAPPDDEDSKDRHQRMGQQIGSALDVRTAVGAHQNGSGPGPVTPRERQREENGRGYRKGALDGVDDGKRQRDESDKQPTAEPGGESEKGLVSP